MKRAIALGTTTILFLFWPSYVFVAIENLQPFIKKITAFPTNHRNHYVLEINGENFPPDFRLEFNDPSIFLYSSNFIDNEKLEAEIYFSYPEKTKKNELKMICPDEGLTVKRSFSFTNFYITDISPDSGEINTQFKVVIKGGNFLDGLIPFSKEWGVYFVDVDVKDANTIEALALIDELAVPGKREISLSLPPEEHSNSIEFNITHNSTDFSTQAQSNRDKYQYGIYEDFNNEEFDGLYIRGPTSSDRDRNLIWWSTGHNQTYPTLTQKDGILDVTTKYDEIRGYWLCFRLAEPEGPIAYENSVLDIARTLTADFYVPEPDINWSHPSIGLTGRYKPPDPEYYQISWGFDLRMRGDDKNSPNFRYALWKLFETQDHEDFIWEGEQVGSFNGEDFNYNTWINLRYDFYKYGDSIWVIDLFVDNILKVRMFPKDAKEILEGWDWWRGPVRYLTGGKPLENKPFTYFLNNIKSIYPWPLIETDKAEITLNGTEGKAGGIKHPIKIRNKGVGVLVYSLESQENWINISPRNGSSWGAWKESTVTIDTSRLPMGNHSGKILITGSNDDYRAGNTPLGFKVHVELEPSSILAPLNFTGTKVINETLFFREYVNALSWKPNPSNTNIKKYRIFLLESTQQKLPRVLIAEVDSSRLEFNHTGVEKDKEYHYALVAVDNAGNSSRSAYLSVK